ncbi:MAG: hypothetical protein WD382_11170, partial [Halofilum sp. (in: g-proteobacteria)]
DLLRRVRDNLCDGASHLARIALDCLSDYTEEVEAADVAALRGELLGFADELVEARPSMAAIRHLVGRWRDSVADFDGDMEALRAHARDRARLVREWANEATEATVRDAIERVGTYERLMTYSMSSTVTRVLMQLPSSVLEVVVPESRPRLEGARLATTLAEARIDVAYITEAQIGVFAEQVEAVIVGADSVLADGAFVNKVGTRLAALAAREAGVPFYVCAESFKCTDVSTSDAVLEEKAGSELNPPHLPSLRARNVYFEVTPAELITEWLSDVDLNARFRP